MQELQNSQQTEQLESNQSELIDSDTGFPVEEEKERIISDLETVIDQYNMFLEMKNTAGWALIESFVKKNDRRFDKILDC